MISESYREQNRNLHSSIPEYGMSGSKFTKHVLNMCNAYGTKDVLDYGCGKATLAASLPFPVHCYDPCIEDFSERPSPADIVVCTDVLEHIEPEHLDSVLDDIRGLAKKAVFLTIANRPAKKTLPDGRNAHLIQEDYRWWFPRIWSRWDVTQFINVSNKEYLIVADHRPH